MADKKESIDAPTKKEFDTLRSYCAQLEKKMRKMDSQIKQTNERLRLAQAAISTAQKQIASLTNSTSRY